MIRLDKVVRMKLISKYMVSNLDWIYKTSSYTY